MTWWCILLGMCLCEVALPQKPQKGCRVNGLSGPDVHPTIGVGVRLYEPELPYLAPWLRHYLKLDVDELCILVTRPEDTKKIHSFVQPFNASGRITLQMQTRRAKWIFKEGDSCSRHTWHANLDPDEFLVLPGNFSRLRDFLARKVGANEVRFEWLFVPYGGSDAVIPPFPRTFTLTSTKPYAFGGIGVQRTFGRGKYFARTSQVEHFGNHMAKCKGPDDRKEPCCQGPPGYLLHVTRGVADAVLRQRTSDEKQAQFSKSRGSTRLKYLAFLELCLSQEAFTVQMPPKVRGIRIAVNKELEARLLAKTGLSMEKGKTCKEYAGCTSMSGIESWYASFKAALFAHHGKVLCDLRRYCMKMLPDDSSAVLIHLEAEDLRDWNKPCL